VRSATSIPNLAYTGGSLLLLLLLSAGLMLIGRALMLIGRRRDD